jgi:hypothetical protein
VRYAPRTDVGERDPFPTQPAPYPASGASARDSGIYNAAPGDPKLATYDNMLTANYWTEPYNRNDYVPNPNGMLAHDTRCISRTSIMPLRVPVAKVNSYNDFYDSNNIYEGTKHYGGYRQGYQRIATGDYSTVAAMDMRDVPPAVAIAAGADPTQRYTTTYPNGPQPITLYYTVQYPKTAPDIAPGTFTSTLTTDIPINNDDAQFQPLLWASLFHRLNYFGLYEYMTPGTPLMFWDRNGRTLDNFTVPLPPFTYGGLNSGQQGLWYQYVLTNDFAFSIGNQDLATRMGERYIPSRGNEKNRNARPYRMTVVLPMRPCWPYKDNGTYDQGDFDQFNWQFPFTIFLGTGEYDYDMDAEQANMQMSWLLDGAQTEMERGSMARSDSMSLSTTVWLPYNQTDFDRYLPSTGTLAAPTSSQALIQPLDYTSKPASAPIMKTSIMRYGRLCGSQDLTVTIVSVEDPLTGKKTELTCNPFGTTYRGARQHWRLYAPALTVAQGSPGMRFGAYADGCEGDYYDVQKGPYAP